jgi:hypothetical protein
MNDATRLEQTTASMLIVYATEMLEDHHEPEDLDAAVKAVLVMALQQAYDKPMRPIEELFCD